MRVPVTDYLDGVRQSLCILTAKLQQHVAIQKDTILLGRGMRAAPALVFTA